jgi:hypothetical protein
VKKSMAFIPFLLALAPAMPLIATEEAPQADQVAMAFVPGNPLMQLPGMRPGARIPLSPITAQQPTPLITDLINAPNPFDSRRGGLEGQTRISYTLAKDASVRVTLYDLLGFRVRRWDFAAGQNGGVAGQNAFMWDGTNEAGQKVSKGGYLAQIEIETPETVVTVIRKIGVIH